MTIFDVPSFNEKLEEASNKQDTVRAESLFLDVVPLELCGVSIKPMNIQHFLILDSVRNGVMTGTGDLFSAASFIYVLRRHKVGRLLNLIQILLWARQRKKENHFTTLEEIVTGEVNSFLDRNTLDMVGRYSERKDGFVNPLEFPRSNYAVDLIADIMGSFPSLTLTELKEMPLPLFWQFLRLSIQKKNPEYIGTQPTDIIKMWGLSELRRLREGQIS